jgi:uncharacterized membrane protein
MTDHKSPAHAEWHPLTWLRNSFLAGVAVVLPFVVTVWLIWTVVSLIDHNVAPLLPRALRGAAEAVPGLGLVFAVIALTLIGALAANLVGRWVVETADRMMANVPFVRSIYGGAKQVFAQIAHPESTSFQKAVLVEFPMANQWTIGFLTNDDAAEIVRDMGPEAADLVAVYVPQAPIPTSGFLIYYKRSDIKELSMSTEEALKRVISMGIIRDNDADKLLAPKR